MSSRTVTHATFVIERDYEATPARVFDAWGRKSAKEQWFGPPGGGAEHELDFRIGGREHFAVNAAGALYTYDAVYQDIVPGERIVYTYNMHRDVARMSVSVATIELLASGQGTHLRYTEQGAFLDDIDTPRAREHGTREMLEKLGETLLERAGA